MDSQATIKRCFVIGPMADMDRLHRLAKQIVLPIIAPEGYTVSTPEEGEIGSIMHQVLLNLEQADLLVADISNHNPNVMYELGVYHSFGKPYIVIKDAAIDVDSSKTPFDIAAFRYSLIDTREPEKAMANLSPVIVPLVKKINALSWYPNPVTAFYGSPVAEIPTAVGLSKNYLQNFLGMLLPKVFFKNENGTAYELEVKVQAGDPPSEFEPLSIAMREKLRFEILIPKEMRMADHNYIRNLKANGILPYKNAKVFRLTRDFNLHMRFDDQGNPVLADIPTVLSTLHESISRRRGNQAIQISNSDWKLLEQQELERFATKCEHFKKELEDQSPGIEGRINVICGWTAR